MLNDIENLPGIGEQTAQKMRASGYCTIDAIAAATLDDLGELGISTAKAQKMIEAARDQFDVQFQTAAELLEKRKEVAKLTTGSKVFDDLLGGGVESRSITETHGAYGSGKSQVSMQLAVNVQLPPEKGGLSGKAVIIDSEGSFRPERVLQMAEAVGLDPAEALNNIQVARAYTSDEQMMVAEKIASMAEDQGIKLIVVDSLTALFRSEYVGRGMLAERQQKLNQHLATLHKLADDNNIIVYVTNQVSAKPDQFFGDPTEAIGGNIVGHNSQTRIYLRRGKKGTRVAKLVDSPHLPDGESGFVITNSGIEDI